MAEPTGNGPRRQGISCISTTCDAHDAVRAQKRWDHAGIGYHRLGAHAFIATTV